MCPMKVFATLLALGALALSAPVWAYSETHDEYTLDLKGFSPEIIRTAETMVSRQEGRYPAPQPDRGHQFLYNLLNSEWTEPLQPWGSDRIEDNYWPRKPE